MEESNKSPCQPAGSPHCVYTSTFGFAPLSSLPLSLLIFYPSFPLLPTSYSTIKTPLPLPTRWTWTAVVSRVPSEPSGETGSFDLQFPGPGFPSPFFQLIHPLTPRPWGGEQTSRARGKERESGVEEKMPQLPVSSQATVPEGEGKRAQPWLILRKSFGTRSFPGAAHAGIAINRPLPVIPNGSRFCPEEGLWVQLRPD